MLSTAPLNIWKIYGVPDTGNGTRSIFFLCPSGCRIATYSRASSARNTNGEGRRNTCGSTTIVPRSTMRTDLLEISVRTFYPDCTFQPVLRQHLVIFGNIPSKWWDTTSFFEIPQQCSTINANILTSLECLGKKTNQINQCQWKKNQG